MLCIDIIPKEHLRKQSKKARRDGNYHSYKVRAEIGLISCCVPTTHQKVKIIPNEYLK